MSFFELLDDISLVLNVGRLCVVVNSGIIAVEVCDCVISAWCWHLTGRTRQVCGRVVDLVHQYFLTQQ